MASSDDFFSSLFGAAHRLLGVQEYTPEERRRLKRTVDTAEDITAPAPPVYTDTPNEPTRLIYYEGEQILLSDETTDNVASERGTVPYNRASLSNNNDKASFPYCFIPTSGRAIMAESVEPLPMSNAAEQKLATALGFLREIDPETQVIENVSFPVAHRSWRFTTAVAVVIHRLHVHVAVSADAPYDLSTRAPLHYFGSLDLLKNLYLTEHGWIVLRFSERQALLHTENCVRTVAELIDNIAGSSRFTKLIEAFDPIEEDERPDLSQSVKASQEKERESLLSPEESETERLFSDRVGVNDAQFAIPDFDILDRNNASLKEQIRTASEGSSPFILRFADDQQLRVKPGKVEFFVTKLWREGFPVTLLDTGEPTFVYLDEIEGVEMA